MVGPPHDDRIDRLSGKFCFAFFQVAFGQMHQPNPSDVFFHRHGKRLNLLSPNLKVVNVVGFELDELFDDDTGYI